MCINEKTGFLVDQEDLSGLIKSISRLAKDKTLRKSLGNAGREFVKDKFTINRLVEDQYNLYEKLLSSR